MAFNLKLANINLFSLSLRVNFRVSSQELSCPASSDTLELHFSKFLLESFPNCQLKALEIPFMKVLLKTVKSLFVYMLR